MIINKIKGILNLLLVSIIAIISVHSQSIIEIPFLLAEPKIDGDLSDTCWKNAIEFEGFKTLHPIAGKAPSQKTVGYMFYNSDNLFVSAKCFDNEPFNIKKGNYLKDDKGYSIEIKIPFEAFRIPKHTDSIIMGFKMVRYISRLEEESDFPEINPDNKAHLSQFYIIRFKPLKISKTIEEQTVVDVRLRYINKNKQSSNYDISTLGGFKYVG